MGSAIQVASYGFIRMYLFQILTWQFLRFREGGIGNSYIIVRDAEDQQRPPGMCKKEIATIIRVSESDVLPESGSDF